jgi:hypothetical protein
VLDGKVNCRLARLSFGARTPGFDVAIFTPAGIKGPFATIIFPSFSPTPGAAILPTQVRPPEQGKVFSVPFRTIMR